jgi:hypothetical protein
MSEGWPWWVVDLKAGTTPGGHLIQSENRYKAVGEFRDLMARQYRNGGDSWEDAWERLRVNEPVVYHGPMTTREAFEYDLGWRWAEAIAVTGAYRSQCGEPDAPVTRKVAYKHLGEERAVSIERQTANVYHVRLEPSVYRCAECGHGKNLFAWAHANIYGPLGDDGELSSHDWTETWEDPIEESIQCSEHPDGVIEMCVGNVWCRWWSCLECRGKGYTESDGGRYRHRCEAPAIQGAHACWRPVADDWWDAYRADWMAMVTERIKSR